MTEPSGRRGWGAPSGSSVGSGLGGQGRRQAAVTCAGGRAARGMRALKVAPGSAPSSRGGQRRTL